MVTLTTSVLCIVSGTGSHPPLIMDAVVLLFVLGRKRGVLFLSRHIREVVRKQQWSSYTFSHSKQLNKHLGAEVNQVRNISNSIKCS
jgi:hypothetical protein